MKRLSEAALPPLAAPPPLRRLPEAAVLDFGDGPLAESADDEIDISVIICCHNGASRISRTLDHLSWQEVPAGLRWEVVLVDNASTDDTAETARSAWLSAAASAPLRIVHEPRPGLGHARLCGIATAAGAIITFVDDDNLVSRDWCTRVVNDFSRDARVGILGARGIPVFQGGAQPSWFVRFQSGYAVGPQRPVPGDDQPMGFFYGAGLSLRKRALTALVDAGFRPALLGRSGKQLGAGEDAELSFAIALAGWRLHYDPELTFQHCLPRRRLTEDYLQRLYAGFGSASALHDVYVAAGPGRGLRRRLAHRIEARISVALLKAGFFSLRALRPSLSTDDRLQSNVDARYFLARVRSLIATRRQATALKTTIATWAKAARAGAASARRGEAGNEQDRRAP
ncbi:MAG: glycosyl transferase family 2 [Rhodospirillales bacterium]|jgi:hypothetical protein|nr:glycosyl transferase family 2 [Rhodospirillales bacterium]